MYDDRLFSPYTKDGFTLLMMIDLIKKNVDIDDRLLIEIIKDVSQIIQQGERFTLPCPCGCGIYEVHIPITHYMIERACDLKNRVEKAVSCVLAENEKARGELKLKPDYEMSKGNWAKRSLSPLKKMLRLE